MTRPFAVAALVFLTLATIGVETAADKPWPGMAKESLGRVVPGDTASHLVARIGSPIKEHPVREESGKNLKQWDYPGITITLRDNKANGFSVLQVTSDGSKAKTAAGIGIGSSVADLTKAYGKALDKSAAPDVYSLKGDIPNARGAIKAMMSFDMDAGKVSGIEFFSLD